MPVKGAVKGTPTEPEPSSYLFFTCSQCSKTCKAKARLAGKKVQCPQCGQVVLVPTADTARARPVSHRSFPLVAVMILTVVMVAGAIYANLAFTVSNRDNLRYFPPFEPNVNGNNNRNLGHEYFFIARAMAKGEGFANPF